MIDRPTVLILGAGASAEIDYPLGRELISRIVNARPKQPQEVPEGWSLESVNEYITDLARSEYGSIDAFIGSEEYRHQAAIGKFLVARALKACENIDRLFLPHDNGWYSTLFHSLLDHTNKSYSDRLKIVTFNYDRSVEAYLATALKHRFRMSSADAKAKTGQIQIAHVHGILGKIEDFAYERDASNADELLRIAEQIQTITEIQDCAEGFCNDEYERANSFLEEAARIFVVGFGFHDDNLRRLQFFTPEAFKKRVISGTLLESGNRAKATLERLAQYGFEKGMLHHTGCNGFFQHHAIL